MVAEHAIRPMHWSDLESVAALEAQIHPANPWSLDTWWAELALRPRRHYVVAQAGARESVGHDIVGYAGLDVSGENADVMTIAVDPAQRGTGLGSALLSDLHTSAAGRGVRAVLLEVRADNTGAQALYAKAGYEHVHTRRGYYQPGAIDAIILRAALIAAPRGQL